MQFSICLPACLHQQLLFRAKKRLLSGMYPTHRADCARPLFLYTCKNLSVPWYCCYRPDCRSGSSYSRICCCFILVAFFKSASSCRKLFFFPYKCTLSQTLRNYCHSLSADTQPSASLASRRDRSRADSTAIAYVWLFPEQCSESVWNFYRHGASLHPVSVHGHKFRCRHAHTVCRRIAGARSAPAYPLYSQPHLYCLFSDGCRLHGAFLFFRPVCR